MAEGKKSVLFYVEWGGLFDELTDDEAGRLIKHFTKYVRDMNPEAPDRTTKLLFETIKNQLKRDLVKWETEKEKKSASGIMGNLKRWHLDLYELVISQKLDINSAVSIAEGRKPSHPDKPQSTPIANLAVEVEVEVEGIVKNTNSIEERKLKFSQSLIPFVEKYGKETIRQFCDYWTEPNKSKTKFKQETEKTWDLEGRLRRWAENDFSKNKKQNQVNVNLNPVN